MIRCETNNPDIADNMSYDISDIDRHCPTCQVVARPMSVVQYCHKCHMTCPTCAHGLSPLANGPVCFPDVPLEELGSPHHLWCVLHCTKLIYRSQRWVLMAAPKIDHRYDRPVYTHQNKQPSTAMHPSCTPKCKKTFNCVFAGVGVSGSLPDRATRAECKQWR